MALSKKAKSRLKTLIDFMRSLPKSAEQHFSMRTYFSHVPIGTEEHDHDLRNVCVLNRRHLTLCGTTACALGWASVVPEFKRAGLRMDKEGNVFMKGSYPEDAYNQETARLFFDIDDDMALELFDSHMHITTPKQWAAYAKERIAKRNAKR